MSRKNKKLGKKDHKSKGRQGEESSCKTNKLKSRKGKRIIRPSTIGADTWGHG